MPPTPVATDAPAAPDDGSTTASPAMPSTSRKKVFISYAREDRDWAQQKYETLTQAGHEVFLDTESIRAGEDWPARLRRALLDADMVMLGWSDATHRSAWVRSEYTTALQIRAAWNDPGFLIIQRLDDSPLPAALADIQAAEARRIRPRPISLWMRAGAVLCALPLLFVLIHPRAASLGMLALCFGLCLVGVSVPLLLQLAAKRRDAIAAGCRHLGAWLMDPDRVEMLRRGHAALRWIYGDRFFSRRTLVRAIGLSSLVVTLTLGASVFIFGWDAGLRLFLRPMAGGVPYVGWIIGLNILCDLLSLGSTWLLLRWALRHPQWTVLALLVIVDLLLAAGLALIPTALGPMLDEYRTHGQWVSDRGLVTTIMGSDPVSLPMPSAFMRPDVLVPNATAEWLLWHEVPWHGHLHAALMLPNTLLVSMALLCLFTACLPSLLLVVVASAAALPPVSRWLSRLPALLLIWVGETRRPIVSGAYAIGWPLAVASVTLMLAFDGGASGSAFAPQLAGLGERSLIEACRSGEGLDAIDHCLVAARRLRDRRAHVDMARVLLVSRGRLLDRVVPRPAEACDHPDCWSIDPRTLTRLIQQYAIGDPGLLREAFPARVFWRGQSVRLRLGSHDIPWGFQISDPFAIAETLDALSALGGSERLEVIAERGAEVHRRMFRLDGAEPTPPWTDIRPGVAQPIEIRTTTQLRVHADWLEASPDPMLRTRVRFEGPADRVWRIDPNPVVTRRHLDQDNHNSIEHRLHWVGIAPPQTPAEALFEMGAGQSFTYWLVAPAARGWPRQSADFATAANIGVSAHAASTTPPAIDHQLVDLRDLKAGVEVTVPGGAGLLVAPPVSRRSVLSSRAPIEPSDGDFGVAWGDGHSVRRSEAGWAARWSASIGPQAFTFTEAPATVRLGPDETGRVALTIEPGPSPEAARYALSRSPIDLRAGGWIRVWSKNTDVVRLRVDAPLLQANGRWLGRIIESSAHGDRLSTSDLLRPPPGLDLRVHLASPIPERSPLRPLVFRPIEPVPGVPGVRVESDDSAWANLLELLMKPGDHLVEVNGHPVADGPLGLDAAGDPAVLRTVDDHITLVVERPDPVERPRQTLPHRIVIEYMPLDPVGSRAWLDEVVGPRPSAAP